MAPFKHESGTSIRGRSRVSHLANKEIKTVLNLAAFCAIRFNQELKIYYEKEYQKE
ncbi:MAG: transposase [Chitinophagaceae bacterium]|nr:transposase [Chitinophagaceae bacterium]